MTRRRQTLEMASYNAMQKEKEAAETRASLWEGIYVGWSEGGSLLTVPKKHRQGLDCERVDIWEGGWVKGGRVVYWSRSER